PVSYPIQLYPSSPPPATPSFPTRRSSALPRRLYPARTLDPGASPAGLARAGCRIRAHRRDPACRLERAAHRLPALPLPQLHRERSEEHTSELQSRENLVCRLLLEKKNIPL